MLANKETCKKYDLSSVRGLFTGAAPLGGETADDLQKQYPSWIIKQGYGECRWDFPFARIKRKGH